MAEEIPLTGGNSAEQVVRIGDTVRKPPTPFDQATTALLHQLAASGVRGVPKALGTDDAGRRILSWVKGSAAFPDTLWSDDRALITAARHLRQIHDASVGVLDTNLAWAFTDPDPDQHHVICHHDFAPYNMTFGEDGSVIGIIDFDLAGPGPRFRDLAYLAWWLVPLGQDDPHMGKATEQDLSNGSKRLTRLCASYGITPTAALLDMIATVLTHMSTPQAARQMIGAAAADRLQQGGHFDHWARESANYATIRPRITANLRLSGAG